jgi:hypothetical protein
VRVTNLVAANPGKPGVLLHGNGAAWDLSPRLTGEAR